MRAYTHQGIFIDLARNYDIDGLHLDYVRYPAPDLGLQPGGGRALYMLARRGTTRAPAPADPNRQAWRRAQVTAFVRDLHHELKQVEADSSSAAP